MSFTVPTVLPKRIQLKGDKHFEEAVAAAAILPGMLVSLTSVGKITPHASLGGVAEQNWAVEDALQGLTINDAYAVGDLAFYVQPRAGDIIYALLEDGENVAIGDKLMSAGNGHVKKQTSTNTTVAIALDAVDLTASANTAAGRVRARIVE